jgi:hypothetical protein
MKWLISSNSIPSGIQSRYNLDPISLSSEKSYLVYNPKGSSFKKNNTMVIIQGDLFPRRAFLDKYQEKSSEEVLFSSWQENPDSFLTQIKGTFIGGIFGDDEFTLFNDRLGIKKAFIYQKGNDFYISNDINIIHEITQDEISPENIAIHALMNRFVGGKTIYRNIEILPPASIIKLENGRLSIKKYWSLDDLLIRKKSVISIEEIAKEFDSVIQDYINFFKPQSITLTLTGGLDSRLILASLLKNNIKPDTYTFGNPESGDVITAQEISRKLGLKHHNPWQEFPSSGWFNELTTIIYIYGQSITSYHRAYRLHGIIEEAKHTNPEMTFAGFLGGESMRGIHYDNLIVSKFAQNWKSDGIKNRSFLLKSLHDKYIKTDELDLDYIENALDGLPYFSKDPKTREFYFLFMLTISNHLNQDINLYDKFHNIIVTPYADIDYLELLFSSQFSMLNQDNTSKNQLKRLKIPEVYCKMIQLIYPPLLNIPLQNGYKPKDYLKGKLFYIYKRLYHRFFKTRKAPNFQYGIWFKEYIEKNWPDDKKGLLGQIFDLDLAKKDISSISENMQEKELNKFTHIIMFHDLLSGGVK